MRPLEGQSALVTGAGRGIGKALAVVADVSDSTAVAQAVAAAAKPFGPVWTAAAM